MVHFEIKDLSFYYPTEKKKPALSHINLKIERGQYVTVCGKSGSGKTTLLRHLKSVLAPHGKTEGEIFFEGKPLKDADLRTQSSRIGYVMQNPDNQIVTDKVWHELAFGLESLGMDQKTIRLRVAEMASYFGIQGWFHKNVTELSGGQKQLLNLASIMAMQPSILILDEPTSQLDPIAATDFLNTVRKINRELRTTIIITEHRLEDIFYASDKVVVVEDGKIIADDEPRKIGDFLKNGNNDMFAAMPTPVQIYYGVKKFQEEKNLKPEKETIKCPLTVREGGDWLSHMFEEKTLAVTRIEEKITTDPDEVKDPAVLVKEVWFRYEKDLPDVVRDLNFTVKKGELFCLLGGNGTGKTTTMNLIGRIRKPYRGKILLKGKEIDKYPESELYGSLLGILPQNPQCLFVKDTVEQDLREMTGKHTDEAFLNDIIDKTEIRHLLSSHPYDLSGGEQQRAALAKVLLLNPEIILMDEPTKGMDGFYKQKLAGILKSLTAEGRTILMVSHDIEFCAEFGDTCALFFYGSIVTSKPAEEFFAGNSFYTTVANRIARKWYPDAVTAKDVIERCRNK